MQRRRIVLVSVLAVVVALGLAIGIPIALSGGSPGRTATRHPAGTAPVHPIAQARVGARQGDAVQLVARSAAAAPASGDVAALARAEQTFGLSVLKQLNATQGSNGNLTVSPASLALALAMLEHGAAGSTLAQLRHTLDTTGLTPDQQGAAWATLMKQWTAPATKVELQSANSLWQQRGLQPLPGFLTAMQRYYSAGVWQADFAHNPTAAAAAINAWVKKHTNGRIPQLFAKLPATTEAVLANAIYFKASWAEPFDPSDTAPGSFAAPGGSVRAQFMKLTGSLPLAHTEGCTAVQLPYRGGRFAALALMPSSGSLAKFTAGLTTAKLRSIADALSSQPISLRLPKFTTNTSLDLTAVLKQLGMTDAFADNADFAKLAKQPLMVNTVVQKDYLAVAEKGTEAAAATGVGMVGTAVMRTTPVNFDHPFLFLVRDTKTGAILFASQVQDPSAS